MDLEQCYRILDVSPKSSADEITRQYQALLEVWCTDRFRKDRRMRETAEKNLAEIKDAYNTIMLFLASGRRPEASFPGNVPPAEPGLGIPDLAGTCPEPTASRDRYRPPPGFTLEKRRSPWRKLFTPAILLLSLATSFLFYDKFDSLLALFGGTGGQSGADLNIREAIKKLSALTSGGEQQLPRIPKNPASAPAPTRPAPTAEIQRKRIVELHLKSGAMLLAESYKTEGDMIIYRTATGTMGIRKDRIQRIATRDVDAMRVKKTAAP